MLTQEKAFMHKIFISYSRKDYSSVVKLKDEIDLLLGKGVCWMDLTGIESDSQFVEVIINAINKSDIFLFMHSKSSEQSDWTRKEVMYANGKGKRLVFVKIDNTPLSDYFAFQFAGHDIIDLNDKKQKQKLLKDLAGWCGARQNTPPPVPTLNVSIVDRLKAYLCTYFKDVTSIFISFDNIGKQFFSVLMKVGFSLNLSLSVFFFLFPVLEGSDSDFLFCSWLLLVVSIIIYILDYLKWIKVNWSKQIEKITLVWGPILFYVLSVIGLVYQSKRLSREQSLTPISSKELVSDSIGKDTLSAEEIEESTENVSQNEVTKTNDNSSKQLQAAVTTSQEEKETVEVLNNAMVDTPVKFRGGESALLQFISQNLVYPVIAQEQEIQGSVILEFVVEKDGSIGDVKVIKSLSKECDQAAIDVVRKLPRFTPARKQGKPGKPVAVMFRLPIRFRFV